VNAEDGKIKQEILLDYSQLLTAEADKPEVINKTKIWIQEMCNVHLVFDISKLPISSHTRIPNAISWR